MWGDATYKVYTDELAHQVFERDVRTVHRGACASFHSVWFTSVAVINPPDWKMANRTYVQCAKQSPNTHTMVKILSEEAFLFIYTSIFVTFR